MTTQPTRIVIGYDDSPDADVRPCGPRECPTFAASPCRRRSSWIGGAAPTEPARVVVGGGRGACARGPVHGGRHGGHGPNPGPDHPSLGMIVGMASHQEAPMTTADGRPPIHDPGPKEEKRTPDQMSEPTVVEDGSVPDKQISRWTGEGGALRRGE